MTDKTSNRVALATIAAGFVASNVCIAAMCLLESRVAMVAILPSMAIYIAGFVLAREA